MPNENCDGGGNERRARMKNWKETKNKALTVTQRKKKEKNYSNVAYLSIFVCVFHSLLGCAISSSLKHTHSYQNKIFPVSLLL